MSLCACVSVQVCVPVCLRFTSLPVQQSTIISVVSPAIRMSRPDKVSLMSLLMVAGSERQGGKGAAHTEKSSSARRVN